MSELIFKNYGKSYQLRIQDAQDLEKIQVLGETHWAATSIPISSLNCDPVFISCVDTDQNSRIRIHEVKEAQAWLFRFLANRSHLSVCTDVLNLSDIDTSHPEGQRLRKVAELILTNLNSPGAKKISLAQV
ncbi:MAG: kinesin, partial [Candidatus Orphnella occulta]|nr:kinesin [Candidatus Orphnella occulta]